MTDRPRRLLSACFGCLLTCILTLRVAGATPPAAPANLTARAVAPSCIHLQWTAPPGEVTRYEIEMRVTGDWKPVGRVPAGVTQFDSGGLLGGAGREYSHRVRAVGSEGPGPWATVGPTSTPDAPQAPRGTMLVAPTERFPRNGEGSFILLDGGTLAYYYGAWPSASDAAHGTCIARIVSTDGGRTWSEPSIVLEQPDQDLYHPGMVRADDGSIGMAYTRRHSGTKRAEKVYRFSTDEGVTWSGEVAVSDGGWKHYITGAHDRLVKLQGGRLVVPVFYAELNSPVVVGGKPVAAALVFVSDDHGRTWHRKTPEPLYIREGDGPRNCEEPGIVEYAPGKLLMVHRTLRGWLYESRSEDGGETWTAPARSGIRNPRAPARLERVPGGDAVLMVHNSHVTGEGWHQGARHILALRISTDGGRSWHGYRELEYQQDNVWYDYPSVYWTDDQLHLAYRGIPRGENAWRRVDVLYQKLDRKSLTEGGGQ